MTQQQRRRRVYIAGPISKGDLAHNINQATRAFLDLAAAGFAPLCPHWSSFSGPAVRVGEAGPVVSVAGATPNEMQHADWLAVDLPWVEVADAVLRLPGESIGADLETAHATAAGIPVFAHIDDVEDHFDSLDIVAKRDFAAILPDSGACVNNDGPPPAFPAYASVEYDEPKPPRGIRRRIAESLLWMLGY